MPDLDDFEAESDLHTLVRAKEIQKDQGRMSRAKSFASAKQDQFRKLAEDIPGKASFRNNTVRGSKMEPK